MHNLLASEVGLNTFTILMPVRQKKFLVPLLRPDDRNQRLLVFTGSVVKKTVLSSIALLIANQLQLNALENIIQLLMRRSPHQFS